MLAREQRVPRIRIFVLVAIFLVILEKISAGLIDTEKNDEEALIESVRSVMTVVNEMGDNVIEERRNLKSLQTALEKICNGFQYPVKTKIEVATSRDNLVPVRFKREETQTAEARKVSSRDDYMTTYYAQRKAIMDKYKTRQKAILAKFNRTEDSSVMNLYKKFVKPTANIQGEMQSNGSNTNYVPQNGFIIDSMDNKSYSVPNTTPVSEAENCNSSNLDITGPRLESESYSSHNISRDIRQNESNFLNDTTNGDVVEMKSLPEIPSTFKMDLKNLANNRKSNSAFSNGDQKISDTFVPRFERTTGSSKASVKIYGSPGVHLVNNITSITKSSTIFRNATHEMVKSDNERPLARKIKLIEKNWTTVNEEDYLKSKGVDPSKQYTGTKTTVIGGALEEEWCESCPHDYKWGYCDGKVFFQHNIFLKNHGGSSVDATFGMAIQGPVHISCVEALRFNETRALVTLHSGGPSFNHAKLRFRGFKDEGFSYIMKVWGFIKTQKGRSAGYSAFQLDPHDSLYGQRKTDRPSDRIDCNDPC